MCLPSNLEGEGLGTNRTHESVLKVTLFFVWSAGTAAGLTVLTHISQLLHISFRTYALAAVAVFLLSFIWLLPLSRVQLARIRYRDSKVLLLVLCAGLLGSVLALILHRQALDDYYYVPNALYFLQHPDALMGFRIHYLYSGGIPFVSEVWATAGAYEYVQAVIAYLFKAEFLTVYYIWSVAIIGLMIPLSLFLAVSHFSDNTLSAAVATLMTLGVILLLGETHWTFGNVSFARVFQGKVVLLAVGIPLFVAFSIDYFNCPTFFSWIALFSVGTAFTGTSSSAAIILPTLSIVLLIAHLFSAPTRRGVVKIFCGYCMSLSYVVGYALYLLKFGSTNLDSNSPANQGWPTTFFGHAGFLVNVQYPLTPFLVIGATLLGLLLTFGTRRRFLVAWIVAVGVLFLNPFVAPLLIRYVTTPNIYWRLFYIYPFPLVSAVAVSAAFSRISRLSLTKAEGAVALACSVLLTLDCLLPSSVVRQDNVRVGWPSYKLPVKALEQAKQIAAIAPPGVMLAPSSVAGIVAMLSANYTQMRIRQDAERVWLRMEGRQDEAELRLMASDYLGGLRDDISPLQSLMTRYNTRIRSMVIKDTVLGRNADLRRLLAENKFSIQQPVDGYVVTWR